MKKSFITGVGGVLMAVFLVGCNGADNHEGNSLMNQGEQDDEGAANILERDREILDNRDDGSSNEAGKGGTDANNDFYDGIGGKE